MSYNCVNRHFHVIHNRKMVSSKAFIISPQEDPPTCWVVIHTQNRKLYILKPWYSEYGGIRHTTL
jgi:hypothetical protein